MNNPGYSWRLRASRRMIGKLPRRGRTFYVMAQALFYRNGVYQEVHVHRWRFGRVMDRCK